MKKKQTKTEDTGKSAKVSATAKKPAKAAQGRHQGKETRHGQTWRYLSPP